MANRRRQDVYLFIGVSGSRFTLKVRSLTENECLRGSLDRYRVGNRLMFESRFEPDRESFLQIRDLPETTWGKKENAYLAPMTDSVTISISREWDESQIVFSNGYASEVYFRLNSQFYAGEEVAKAIARFKAHGEVPPLPEGWQEKKSLPLSPYQRAAVKFALDSESFAWFLDRGTGKTGCAIQLVCTLARMVNGGALQGGAETPSGKRMLRVLVACPKNVRLNWNREVAKFAHVKGKVSTLRGDLATRVSSVAQAISPSRDCEFSILVAGYDSIRTTSDYLGLVPWDLVILDESHSIKDPSTDRWKAIEALRAFSSRRVIMTGTPIGNSPMDLWTQLEFLREGLSGFSSFKAFRAFHGIWKSVPGAGVSKLLGLQNIPLLQERLTRCSFSMTKEEAGLNLPDKVYSTVEVEMTPQQAKMYQRLQDELALEIEDKLSGEVVDQVTISSILTMLLRLAQITSGFITYNAKVDPDTGAEITPKRVAEISTNNPKVLAVLEMLQAEDRDPNAKAIIWCQFIHNITHLQAKLTEAGIKCGVYYGAVSSYERDKVVDQFNNDPSFKVLICNPQTAGEGLNLLGYDTANPSASETYCDLEIFFSIGWSAILRGQAEDRAHRRGTRMPVQIVDLIVPGSIDEEILDRLMSKREMATSVTDLREIQKRILTSFQREMA